MAKVPRSHTVNPRQVKHSANRCPVQQLSLAESKLIGGEWLYLCETLVEGLYLWLTLFRSSFVLETILPLASILGPFGVHLLKFILDTHPGSLMHYLGLLEFPVRICDALDITTHTRRIKFILWAWLGFHHWISFCSRVYMNVYGMGYLISRSTWAQRI